jgi:high affinity Mn2+ porin
VAALAVLSAAANLAPAADSATNSVADPPAPESISARPAAGQSAEVQEQNWNWHVQNTDIIQADAGFPAKYSGPNSLDSRGEIRETVSLDLMAGIRLWQGAEAHVDGLMWQGYGLSETLGIEAFPDGEAYRLGTTVPNVNLVRAFIRQTIGLGGEQDTVPDDLFQLAGKQDVSRLTLTLGKISVLDVFDNNTYAHDPRSQFMNWALVGNEAWDYPADSIGYMTGFAAELNVPHWALRYGFFQMPRSSNGMAQDQRYFEAWGMVAELERRYNLGSHPGTVRFLSYLNQAHMGSYADALSVPGVNIIETRAYREKYGFGLNLEQEITKDIGVFSRLGWSDGHTEAWVYSDADRSISLGTSIKGTAWHRADDTFGLAGVASGLSHVHEEFLEAGGNGILDGDGALSYGWEKALETYYDFNVWKTIHASVDYQFVVDPANNRDRGPVSIFAGRLHWQF